MYRQHFVLTNHPFSNEIEPDDLFPGAAAKELEVRLTHLLEMRGVGLVTGDSGSGKTSGTRRVLAKLHASLYRVIYVCLSTGNVLDLYKTIAWEMGLSVERSRASLFRQIKSAPGLRGCAKSAARASATPAGWPAKGELTTSASLDDHQK